MTKRKENPLSRSECARRAGYATAKSANRRSPFCERDEDWKEEMGRKGALEGMRRYPGRLEAMSNNRLGKKATKPNRKSWRNL